MEPEVRMVETQLGDGARAVTCAGEPGLSRNFRNKHRDVYSERQELLP